MIYKLIYKFFILILIIGLIFPCIFIAIIIKLTSKGPIIHWSKRVGINNTLFLMPKFRTMTIGTPDVATHLLKNQNQYIYQFGSLLRKTSIDEIPQLYSILLGHMNIVGPRPALYNQDNLINLRTKNGIHTLKPGITGWAQVNGRDNISIEEKVGLELVYLKNKSFKFDIYIIFLTVISVTSKKNINH